MCAGRARHAVRLPRESCSTICAPSFVIKRTREPLKMLELNQDFELIKDMKARVAALRGYL